MINTVNIGHARNIIISFHLLKSVKPEIDFYTQKPRYKNTM